MSQFEFLSFSLLEVLCFVKILRGENRNKMRQNFFVTTITTVTNVTTVLTVTTVTTVTTVITVTTVTTVES